MTQVSFSEVKQSNGEVVYLLSETCWGSVGWGRTGRRCVELEATVPASWNLSINHHTTQGETETCRVNVVRGCLIYDTPTTEICKTLTFDEDLFFFKSQVKMFLIRTSRYH